MVHELLAILETVTDPFSAIELKVIELEPLEILFDDSLYNARCRSFRICELYDPGTQERIAVISTSEGFCEAFKRIRRGFLDVEHEIEVRDAGGFPRTLKCVNLEVRAWVGILDLIR